MSDPADPCRIDADGDLFPEFVRSVFENPRRVYDLVTHWTNMPFYRENVMFLASSTIQAHHRQQQQLGSKHDVVSSGDVSIGPWKPLSRPEVFFHRFLSDLLLGQCSLAVDTDGVFLMYKQCPSLFVPRSALQQRELAIYEHWFASGSRLFRCCDYAAYHGRLSGYVHHERASADDPCSLLFPPECAWNVMVAFHYRYITQMGQSWVHYWNEDSPFNPFFYSHRRIVPGAVSSTADMMSIDEYHELQRLQNRCMIYATWAYQHQMELLRNQMAALEGQGTPAEARIRVKIAMLDVLCEKARQYGHRRMQIQQRLDELCSDESDGAAAVACAQQQRPVGSTHPTDVALVNSLVDDNFEKANRCWKEALEAAEYEQQRQLPGDADQGQLPPFGHLDYYCGEHRQQQQYHTGPAFYHASSSGAENGDEW
jgi:hypothetical protein